MKTLNDLLLNAVKKVPEKIALATDSRRIPYRELARLVDAASVGFSASKISKGDCVAIIHRNAPEFVVSYFALSRLGAIAVPINYMIHKPAELAYMLNDCGAKGCVTQKEFIKGVRQAAERCPSMASIWISDAELADCGKNEIVFSRLLESPGAAVPDVLVDENDVAAVLYTSGTTGSPKGVMLTHRNLVTNSASGAERLQLRDSDSALCILPMFHTFAWTGNVLAPIVQGIKIVIAPNIVPAAAWLKLMARERVTLFSGVPQIYGVLAKQAKGFKKLVLKWWFFRKVRLAVSGAAPLVPAVQEAFEKAFGVPILEGYGLTETSPVATINALGERRKGSVGRPIPGVQIKIMDDAGRRLGPGEEGEICVKGDCVMKGYLHLPDATAQSLGSDGWLRTGDVGTIDGDGYLFIRDRKKDMIIVKGLKVFSAQLEAVLLEHPKIAEAAVIGIPDEHGDEIIKAFLVPREGSTLDKAEAIRYCREKFDAYKRPRDVEIVDALPKNALQKILKRELRQREIEKRAASVRA
ncbi:MAG: long-chain-fatty-acid--CoA ligase [Elusimicrobiota bacterium]